MNIHNELGGKIVEMPNVAYTYQVAETPRDFDRRTNSDSTLMWNNVQNFMGDYIVYPYGSNNDLPQIIKNVVDNSYNVPGFLKRKTDILWGAGPKLYRDELQNNKDIRVRVIDAQIQKWLESFKYQEYLLKCMSDYQHLQATFTRLELNKGSRIGRPFINKLHHVQPNHARLGRLRNAKDNAPTHILTSSWNFNNITAISDSKAYPIFDSAKPFDSDNSMIHSNMYTFCTDYYNVPALYGSIEWINRSTAVPLIFKAFAKNSMNLKYHIISPASFWDKKRTAMVDKCRTDNTTYDESMMVVYEREFLKQIGDVLSGYENSGKYFHTTMGMVVRGHDIIQEGWEVKVLDQKVKDFVQSQILISDKADKAIASAINIHPVLANMTDSGKANSGSEQIYALLNYLNTGVDIDEMIICNPINHALNANFPYSGLKIGFFHNAPEMQQNTSPAERTHNATQKD
jgi:thiamine phosphate synthase YjbQ (UPF0047 family)